METTTKVKAFMIPMECRTCGQKWQRLWLANATIAPCPKCNSVDLKVDEGGDEAR